MGKRLERKGPQSQGFESGSTKPVYGETLLTEAHREMLLARPLLHLRLLNKIARSSVRTTLSVSPEQTLDRMSRLVEQYQMIVISKHRRRRTNGKRDRMPLLVYPSFSFSLFYLFLCMSRGWQIIFCFPFTTKEHSINLCI